MALCQPGEPNKTHEMCGGDGNPEIKA
jgi:hypothetical protein